MDLDVKGVILAGGLGKRLRPITDERPKPMIEVCDRPIIEWQIRWFKNHKIDEIVICVGYLKERIIDYIGSGSRFGVRVGYAVEEEPLGTGGALKNARSLIESARGEGFFMVNGDILTDLDPNVLKHTRNSALALVPLKSPYGVIELDKNGLVTGFVEKPLINDRWINAGVYFFTSNVFDILPDHGNIETSALPVMAQNRNLMGVTFSTSFWRSVDSHKDMEEATKEILGSGLVSRGD
jgi:mannose-1-phosphate guanylyltransferase